MSENVIILGAGGHAKVIADIVLSSEDVLIGFLDDKQTGYVFEFPILGKISEMFKYEEDCSFIIGIGNNYIRKQIAEKYDVRWYTAVHPSAIIAHGVSLGEGTAVMAGAIINPSTTIGKHCIINTGVVVEHDNRIKDYVHISPNATLCGTVNIGSKTHIGAGATIINNIDICPDVIIGAGAVVTKDIFEEGKYLGVPIRKI